MNLAEKMKVLSKQAVDLNKLELDFKELMRKIEIYAKRGDTFMNSHEFRFDDKASAIDKALVNKLTSAGFSCSSHRGANGPYVRIQWG